MGGGFGACGEFVDVDIGIVEWVAWKCIEPDMAWRGLFYFLWEVSGVVGWSGFVFWHVIDLL